MVITRKREKNGEQYECSYFSDTTSFAKLLIFSLFKILQVNHHVETKKSGKDTVTKMVKGVTFVD